MVKKVLKHYIGYVGSTGFRPMHNNTIYNECIKTKVSPYNEKFHGNKKLIKDRYFGNSILFIYYSSSR